MGRPAGQGLLRRRRGTLLRVRGRAVSAAPKYKHCRGPPRSAQPWTGRLGRDLLRCRRGALLRVSSRAVSAQRQNPSVVEGRRAQRSHGQAGRPENFRGAATRALLRVSSRTVTRSTKIQMLSRAAALSAAMGRPAGRDLPRRHHAGAAQGQQQDRVRAAPDPHAAIRALQAPPAGRAARAAALSAATSMPWPRRSRKACKTKENKKKPHTPRRKRCGPKDQPDLPQWPALHKNKTKQQQQQQTTEKRRETFFGRSGPLLKFFSRGSNTLTHARTHTHTHTHTYTPHTHHTFVRVRVRVLCCM